MATKRIGNINVNYVVPETQTQMWNALGRDAGLQSAEGANNPNFFQKRFNSLENAFGTTGAAIASKAYDTMENLGTEQMLSRQRESLDNIAKKYGYANVQDFYNKYGDAENANDTNFITQANNSGIWDELKSQTAANANEATNRAKAYEDYRKNNYVSQKINQDRGKFAGSAINTLSTMADLSGIAANPLANAVQGGVEGLADELEQNGLENFDLGRAGQNALIGATTGAVTGALNKGISNSLAKKGGNLFRGGNALTRGLNDLGSKTALGRVGSTIATGAARGAVSGAVGGATGAGLSSALNRVDFGQGVQNALQGAVQGAQQGAMAGGIMAGANMAISKTPGVGKFYNELQNVKSNWDKSGSNFDERLTNTLTSGDSAVGDWLMGKNSKVLNAAGSLGNTIRNIDNIEEKWADGTTNEPATRAKKIRAIDDSINGKARLAMAKEIHDNPREWNKLLSDIADRAETLKTQYNKDGTRPWFNDSTSTYDDIDRNVLSSLELNDDLSGHSAAAVAQVLRERGLTSNIPTTLSESDYQAFINKYDQEPNTPTTIKGWLKRAGERIVEDVNNSNLGNRIKDVSNNAGVPDDIMNRLNYLKNEINNERISYGELAELQNYAPEIIKLGDTQLAEWAGIPEEEFSGYKPTTGFNSSANNTQPDTWDKLAQQKGYNNYDEVIQRYIEANPGVELNPRGAAGQILTWLDQNPNTPTTATGWVKRAGERIVEDANNRGLGMRIQDVSESAVDESPETEVYRRLTGDNGGNRATSEDLPEIFEPEARNRIESKNKLQLVGKQFKNAGEQIKRRSLYGSLDAATATRATETKAPQLLSEMGIEPENYLEAAKTSNYVNQVVSDIAKDSKVKVNLPDLATELAGASDGVTFVGTDAPKKFNKAISQIVADGSTPDEYTAGYLIEKSRDFGNKAAKIKDNSPDSKALRTALNNAKYILRDAANTALADANVTSADTNANIAKGLAKMGANQKVIDYYTKANDDGSAPGITDYIRRSSTFEQARDMGTQIQAEKLTRSASKEPTRVSTKILRASGLEEPMEIILNNTVAPLAGLATKAVGGAIEGVGNVAARIRGDNTGGSATAANNTVIDANYNPATQIYNAIGRTEGLTNAEQAKTANYLADAVQEATVVPNTNGSLENLLQPNNASNSVYNAIYGNPTTTRTTNTGYFQPTGDYWTDILATAMSSAIDNNDVDSFASLYSMYQDALSKLQSSSTTGNQKLTATQQRANAAMNSLERLSSMTPDLAYNLSNIPIVGGLATLGGNDYEAEAKSLAQQIGYMVSGSNIKESEAENIGKSYVPQPWDNEQVRKNKLRRAYEIISQYQNGYAEA